MEERADWRKFRFYDEMTIEWDLESSSEIIVSLWHFNGHVGKCAEAFEGVHGGMVVGKELQNGRRLLEFCDEKELCVANTWFYKIDKRKIINSSGGCGTEIDLVLVGGKIQKVCKGCESDCMGTLAQTGGRRFG